MGLSGQALENLHQMMKRGGGKLNNRRYSVNRMTGAVPQKKMGVGMLEQVVTHQCASEACRYLWSLCSCCCVCVLCVCALVNVRARMCAWRNMLTTILVYFVVADSWLKVHPSSVQLRKGATMQRRMLRRASCRKQRRRFASWRQSTICYFDAWHTFMIYVT